MPQEQEAEPSRIVDSVVILVGVSRDGTEGILGTPAAPGMLMPFLIAEMALEHEATKKALQDLANRLRDSGQDVAEVRAVRFGRGEIVQTVKPSLLVTP